MSGSDVVSAPSSVLETAHQFVEISRQRVSLFKEVRGQDGGSLMDAVLRKEAPSEQKASPGRKEHPFDYSVASSFQLSNAHHSTCIHTKVAAAIGLGFTDSLEMIMGDPLQGKPDRRIQKKSKVEKALDPLCDHFFMDVLSDSCEDFFQVGNGYMEVIRAGNAIKGIHSLPAPQTFVEVEEGGYEYHYKILPGEGMSTERTFVRFGEKKEAIARLRLTEDPDKISEVIHFRRPTSLSPWYGYPDWLSAVPSIELQQCMTQYQYDFFLNRGVPEFMLFVMGQKLPPDDWTKIENALKANIGLGNTHKSLALNLSNPEIKIQLEKLGIDQQPEGGFEQTETSKALTIVTAHRVPPLLAGIQIPGKMGAANEMINAMMAFQTLVIEPVQALFQKTLGSTLGEPSLNGGLTVGHDDFTFRTVLDSIDPQRADTIGRMRQELPTANAQGRDIKAGLKQ